MKPETIRLLRRIMFLYFVPWLYFDVAGMLAMTGVYYLPLIPLSPTNNGFFTLLATALDSIIVGAVGLIGWTYVNRQWRRLRPKSPWARSRWPGNYIRNDIVGNYTRWPPRSWSAWLTPAKQYGVRVFVEWFTPSSKFNRLGPHSVNVKDETWGSSIIVESSS